MSQRSTGKTAFGHGLFELSDDRLAELLDSGRKEAARRAAALSAGDSASIIRGNEAAKRAILVAAAGNHSVLLAGGPGTGKTMLRALAFELGAVESYEIRPCPCGNAWHLAAACHCTPEMIQHHAANWPATQIQVQTEHLNPRALESQSSGLTIGEMRKQVAGIGPPLKSQARSEDVQYLLKAAVAELALDGWQVATTWSVAQTIARLDHVCEAINYRMLLAGVWEIARNKQTDAA